MNDNFRARPPEPGPACAYFAPLLPLVGQERLNPGDANRLRQHLATCDYCQSELDSYNQMDDLLARHFGPVPRGPLSPADIRELTSPTYRLRAVPLDPQPQPELNNHHAPRRSALLHPTRPQPARRSRRMIPALSAIAAVLVIAAIGLALFASGGRFFNNTANQTPAPTVALPVYTPGGDDAFSGIAMVSPNEGWIVGSAFTPATSASKPLILHYLNGRLYQVNYLTLPGVNTDAVTLTQVSMISATEGWAMGTFHQANSDCDNTLFLRYTGGRWKQDSILSSTTLSSIALASPTNGWAVGSHDVVDCHLGASELPMLYHYDGKKWSPAAVPSGTISLSEVVMTSANNGWAIGVKLGNGIDPDPGLLLHYNGKSWSEVSVPGINQLGIVAFDNIAMASATDGWLLGRILQSKTTASIGPYAAFGLKAVLFHFDGKQWQKASTLLDNLGPLGGSQLALAPDGSGWLATLEQGIPTIFLTLHLSGGVWSEVENLPGLYPNQIAPLSADDAWAVSNDEKGTYLLHYHNGAWESVSLTPPTPTATATSQPPINLSPSPTSCDTITGPTLPAPGQGTPVPTVPFTTWKTYTSETVFSIKYPAGWRVDDASCGVGHLDLIFTNYDPNQVTDADLPPGAIKIELNLSSGGESPTSALDFWQVVQQYYQPGGGGPVCASFTTQQLQVAGRDSVEGGCPSQNWDTFIIPDHKNMLQIMETAASGITPSDLLTQMVNTLAFTD